MTNPHHPPERPNGSFVKYTRTGHDGRPTVSVLVREDDPRNPGTPDRWRPVEGNSRWFTWEQLHTTGSVEPLFTGAELAAAASSRQQAHDRGFIDGFQRGKQETAQAAEHAATHAQATTTAGQQWLKDLASHAQQLQHTTANPAPPPEADLLRTRPDQLRAAVRHLPPDQARQAAYRYGFAAGHIAAIGPTVRDLYLAAGQALGSLRPVIDGRPANRWLETARLRWLDTAAYGDLPLPSTAAALARSTLTAGTTTTRATGQPAIAPARPAHGAARPAPGVAPRWDQTAATPTPARGVAPVARPSAARR